MEINQPTARWINLPFMRKEAPLDNDKPNELRLPFIGFLPNKIRNHFVAVLGEFIGTFLFLFFAFAATQVANTAREGAAGLDKSVSDYPNVGTLLYISLGFGFSLAVNAWAFFRISGGLFNPAVTLGLVLIGAVGWMRAALVVCAQIVGAISAAAVVSGLFDGELIVATELGAGTSVVKGFFIETFLTAELVFVIIMLAAEKHKGTFIAPIGIGLALFVAELTGVYFTGGSLNPARSFGPCVVLGDFPSYHWMYWIGPFFGSILAAIFYHLVKVLEYETANPGQDFDEKEAERFVFDEKNAATHADVMRPDVGSPSPLRARATTGENDRGRSTSPVTIAPQRSGRTLGPRSLETRSISRQSNGSRPLSSESTKLRVFSAPAAENSVLADSGFNQASMLESGTADSSSLPSPTRPRGESNLAVPRARGDSTLSR